MGESIKLALEVLSHFDSGAISIHPGLGTKVILNQTTSPGVTSVRGILNLSYDVIETKATVACAFFFPADWRIKPPHLRCTKKWLRTSSITGNQDWHVNGDNTLCYVLGPQWADQIASIEQNNGADIALAVAAFHAVNNARWLLYHHFLGYRRKMTEWPDEWPQWPHFESGLAAYERVRKRGVKFTHQ